MRNKGVMKSLPARFSLLTLTVLVVAIALYIPWNIQRQQEATERSVLNEARTLNQQMTSVWQYIDVVQPLINYDSNGRYEFKHVYCANAAKAIAYNFTTLSDYTIRYVREDPRIEPDTPDDFESQALSVLNLGDSEEYSDVSTYEDESVFRYVTVLRVQANCLECHGSPAGEPDITGYLKEGYEIGDIAGAVSIIIPLKQYQDEAAKNAVLDILFFIFLTTMLVFVVNIAFRKWISRPLRAFEQASNQIAVGNWKEVEELLSIDAKGELGSLQKTLISMSNLLQNTQELLEEKIAQRTADLMDANNQLHIQHAQIDEAYQALQQANDKLQMTVQYKSDFLSIMSHELKTPIAAIMASLALWEDTNVEVEASKTKESEPDKASQIINEANNTLARNISLNAHLLLRMVNNILDAAKMEAQRLEPHYCNVDLIDVLGEIERSVAPLARLREVSYTWSVSNDVPIIVSDPNLLHRILDNIVNNAIKFSNVNGSVSLNTVFNNEFNTVCITIEDNGIGIPSEYLETIFEQFTQADPSFTREYQGTGLGLSVARQMARIMGGDIRVTSIVSQGSVFSVVLPIDARTETTQCAL